MDSFDTSDEENAALKALTLKIHRTLAHSYTAFFAFFLIGIFFNSFFPVKFLDSSLAVPFGFSILVFATVLIFWAQRTSRYLKKESPTVEHFCRGPYCYSRSPTHWGLFFLMLGFGIIINSGFVILFSLMAFFVTKMIFIKKEEEALAQKYGEPYLEYKRKVKL